MSPVIIAAPRRNGLSTLSALVMVAAAALSACSTDDGSAASPSTPTTEAVVLEVGSPVPALPDGINAVPYGIGQVAGLGNMQVTLRSTDRAEPDTLHLDLEVRNGSRDVLVLDPSLFRQYFVDGSSVTPTSVEVDGSTTARDVASGATALVRLTVEVADGREPALFLVDGSSSDPRNLPGGFVLDTFTVTDADADT